MVAPDKQKPDSGGSWSPDRITAAVFGFFHVIAAFSSAFGAPFVMLCLAFAVVWVFGTDKTQDDFIRELLFSEVTSTPTLKIFFAALFLLAMLALHRGRKRGAFLETEEMNRIATEKSQWQERALGGDLSHTLPPPGTVEDNHE